MRKLAFLMLLLFSTPSCAWIHGSPANGGGGGVTCAHSGAGYADGCAAAPTTGQIQHSTFFTGYAQQSGQSWSASRPPWDAAGADYPVGATAADASLVDPSVSPPASCTWDAIDDWVDCTGSGALVVAGFDFSLHNGMRIRIHGSYTSVDIHNNHFKNGSASDNPNDLIRIEDEGVATTRSITSNTLDGNGGNFYSIATIIFDFVTHAGSGALTFRYNACLNFPGKCIEYSGAFDVDQQFNYYESITALGGQHGEVANLGATGAMTTFHSAFNTGLMPSNAPTGGAGGAEAFDWISNGSGGLTIGTINETNNVYVVNTATGTGASIMSTPIAPAYNPATTLNFTQNYIDPTGANFCINDPTGLVGGTTHFTGNVDLINGSAITAYGTCFGVHP